MKARQASRPGPMPRRAVLMVRAPRVTARSPEQRTINPMLVPTLRGARMPDPNHPQMADEAACRVAAEKHAEMAMAAEAGAVPGCALRRIRAAAAGLRTSAAVGAGPRGGRVRDAQGLAPMTAAETGVSPASVPRVRERLAGVAACRANAVERRDAEIRADRWDWRRDPASPAAWPGRR